MFRSTLTAGLLLGMTLLTPSLATAAEPVLSIAILGDAEPKPRAEFPGLAAAVGHVNHLADIHDLDFVIGVGDIAHKGTEIQYEAVTPVLQRLTLPFYPIMGNEEHGASVARYMEYVQRWNDGKAEISAPSHVLEFERLALVMASPDEGRDFNDQGVAWVLEQLQRLAPKPVLLVVHGAPAGTFPERADKGIHHPGFADVSAQPNLVAMISGDLHMDLERSEHSKQIDGVHHLHIPALERTKIPDDEHHVPMFRVLTVMDDDQVIVDTYQVGIAGPLARHDYRFELRKR
ncbi:MAG: metallophosphoesterase [Porticoccaceae bacterium]